MPTVKTDAVYDGYHAERGQIYVSGLAGLPVAGVPPQNLSVVRLAAAFVVRPRRGRESGWTTAQSPGVGEKCGKPMPSSSSDAMSLRS